MSRTIWGRDQNADGGGGESERVSDHRITGFGKACEGDKWSFRERLKVERL